MVMIIIDLMESTDIIADLILSIIKLVNYYMYNNSRVCTTKEGAWQEEVILSVDIEQC